MRGERGFTLVEMIVATVILAVGIAGAVATFGAISRASGTAAEYDQAALLAERRLAEIETLDETPTDQDSGDFGEDYPGYKWEQEVLSTEYDDLIEVRVTVTWGNNEPRHHIDVSTYMKPVDSTQVPS